MSHGGRPPGKVRVALRLLTDHPEACVPCDECRRYLFVNGVRSDDWPQRGPDGKVLLDAAGEPVLGPQPRPAQCPPPCHVCPKLEGVADKRPLADADDPFGGGGWVWQVADHARGLMAWGERPADPLARAVGRIVAEADRRRERADLAAAVERAVRRALSKR